jgi:hypothetical protein
MTTYHDVAGTDLILNCGTCKHSGADPDGMYCGHKKSFDKSAGYGQGTALARSTEGVCGPDASLYEKCLCKRKGCPRHE